MAFSAVKHEEVSLVHNQEITGTGTGQASGERKHFVKMLSALQ